MPGARGLSRSQVLCASALAPRCWRHSQAHWKRQSNREWKTCQVDLMPRETPEGHHSYGKMRTHLIVFECPLPRVSQFIHTKDLFTQQEEVPANSAFLRQDSLVPNAWVLESGQHEL